MGDFARFRRETGTNGGIANLSIEHNLEKTLWSMGVSVEHDLEQTLWSMGVSGTYTSKSQQSS